MFPVKKHPRSMVIFFFLSAILVYLLWWRWQVSATRFFDVDEFSYMHWTAQIARGEHMYTDFFSYFTPGFMWAFAPIYWIYGASVQVFTAGRTVSFAIFLGILGGLGMLFGMTRGWKWALLPVIILAFLPMPYDKFFEIRPDNLATLLTVIGVIGEIWAIRVKKKIWWLVSGLAYSASLFVLAKMLPIVAVGALIALLSSPKKFVYFLSGLLGPWMLFFLGAVESGNLGVVWYSLTRLPLEVYKSAVNFHMEANLFFYPNDWFYGGDSHSISLGLIVNHAIWILALFVGAYRLVTPMREGKKDEMFIELLVAGVFFVSVATYVKFFPLKHSQYLIPIAALVAYYAADGLASLFDWFEHAGGYMSLAIVLVGFGYLLIAVTKDVNAPKLLNTNTMQRTEFTLLLRTIPLSARVVDLEGRMVFWPDGYPISSLPFDGFLPYLSHPPQTLARYLTEHPAEYIYDGDSNRMVILAAENLSFIRAYYAPVPGFGERLWKKK